MPEIRYWNSSTQVTNENMLSDSRSGSGDYKAFEAMMMEKLLGSSMSSGYSDIFSTNSSTDFMFGDMLSNPSNLEGEIESIQNQGLGKVLAARLGNPLPDFGQTKYDNNKSKGMSSLNDMISLTMQAEMLKAKKAIQHQVMTNEKYSPLDECEVSAGSSEYKTIDEFVSFIQQQITVASEKLDLDEAQLKEKLLNSGV